MKARENGILKPKDFNHRGHGEHRASPMQPSNIQTKASVSSVLSVVKDSKPNPRKFI